MLTVLFRDGSKSTYAAWRVRCDCGAEKTINGHNLRKGTRSCGCATAGWIKEKVTRHGQTHTRTWASWQSMRQRCERPGDPSYKRYGGRGISVCVRWSGDDGFENFLADMGERPAGKTIDRFPEKNGNYEPGNCRWATAPQQQRNTRTNRPLTMRGRTMLLCEWAEETGLKSSAITERISRGWTVEDALTVPISTTGPRFARGHRRVKRAG